MTRLLSATSLLGDDVINPQTEEKLGKLKELMIDTATGRIGYAVLSFGGFMGMGDKLFAIPWQAFSVHEEKKHLHLNVDKEVLKSAPGFDKDNWPNFTDLAWGATIYRHYGYQPYWE